MKEVVKFWEVISGAEFDELLNLLAEDCEIIFPNTNEIFISPQKYVEFNKAYPGRWYATVKDIMVEKNRAISITLVESNENSFYCTSVFEFSKDKISRIYEYWGDNGSVPSWRTGKGFTKKWLR